MAATVTGMTFPWATCPALLTPILLALAHVIYLLLLAIFDVTMWTFLGLDGIGPVVRVGVIVKKDVVILSVSVITIDPSSTALTSWDMVHVFSVYIQTST